MTNAILIHGSYGEPNENWFPWISSQLKDLNIDVIIPKFPTPENQSIETWNKVFDDYKDLISSDTILIGHSLGGAFIFDILENIKAPVKAVFLAAPFVGLLENKEFDDVNYSFVTKDFDWDKIKQNGRGFYIYHSDNDPYVPQSKSQFLADKLSAKKYDIIANGGHLNSTSGFDTFPTLLNDIKRISHD